MTEQESRYEHRHVDTSAEHKQVSEVSFGDSVVSSVMFSGHPARVFAVNASDERPSVEVILVRADGTYGLAGGTIYFDQIDEVIPGNDYAVSETTKIVATLQNGSTTPLEISE